MPYVRDSFWRGRTWDTIEQMQAAAIGWCATTAGNRSHRALEGASPIAVFNAVTVPALKALPHQVFEVVSWCRPKVAHDCHIAVAGVLYSVPWRLVGQHVDVRLTRQRVEVFVAIDLVKTHLRATKGRVTDYADYPPDKIAFFQRTPVWCRHRASELGPNVQIVVEDLLATNVLHRLRAAQGILRLADKHPAARLDAACRRAVEVGNPAYLTIRGILNAGTETDGQEQETPPSAPAHLHGPERLFNGDTNDIDIDGEVA